MFRTRNFTLYTKQNDLPQARLGVVVAKRLAPRAVTRNLVKRIAREVFRQSALPALDCIIRLSGPLNTKADPASSSALRKQVHAQMRSLLDSQLGTGSAAPNLPAAGKPASNQAADGKTR
ncbi:MAG: Ribonuclease protein component [Paucimonas sp.]|nr:Ribonuclease protein component [Paucimonas sp.]